LCKSKQYYICGKYILKSKLLSLSSKKLKINELGMKILEKKYQNAQECPITIFMEKIGGKWKPVIVWLLLKNGTMRFNELDKAIKGVTQKMLSQQLKGLEEADIVQRVVYPVIPPKVEYSLTEKGKTLLELMEGIMQWSKINLQEK
jgi:DNA-binding HxlR family transcriptional regulator